MVKGPDYHTIKELVYFICHCKRDQMITKRYLLPGSHRRLKNIFTV